MTDRLDDDLERLIMELAGTKWRANLQPAIDALRLRIQQLLSEARAEGARKQAEADRQTVRDFR